MAKGFTIVSSAAFAILAAALFQARLALFFGVLCVCVRARVHVCVCVRACVQLSVCLLRYTYTFARPNLRFFDTTLSHPHTPYSLITPLPHTSPPYPPHPFGVFRAQIRERAKSWLRGLSRERLCGSPALVLGLARLWVCV